MRNLFKRFGFFLVLASFTGSVLAAEDKGTEADAIAMVKNCVKFWKENGKEKTVAEVLNPTGQFNKGVYYAVIHDMAGNNIAHGKNPKIVGKPLIDMRDAEGKYLIQDFIKVGKSKEGKGWTEYKWPNPVTKAVEEKKTYTEKIDDNTICGVGIYK